MIKICFVISSLCEGPTNVLYNIIKYMDFSTFDVSVVTMVKEKPTTRIDDFRALPIKIYQVSGEKDLSKVELMLKTRSLVMSLNPDIVHAHCPRSRMLMPMLPSRFIRIETIHNYPDLPIVLYGNVKGRIVKLISLAIERRLDLCIGCSESIAKDFKNRGMNNVIAIPNGCDLPLWHYDANEKAALRKKFGFDENLSYFIFIGRFSEEKRPELVIKAFQKMADKPIGVIMLGNGRMYNSLKKYETERILMPGFKTNVYDYMKAADYYLSASDTEGMPNSLLESMTVGLPSVLSDIPAHEEVLSKSEYEMGVLYDNSSEDNMVKVINKVLNIDKGKVANNIQTIFSKYYTAELMSHKYQAMYRDLITKNTPPVRAFNLITIVLICHRIEDEEKLLTASVCQILTLCRASIAYSLFSQ